MTATPSSTTPVHTMTAGVWRRPLTYITLLGLALRLAVVLYADRRPARFDFPDTHRYLTVARNLADGRGPVESDRVLAGTDPLYPLLLSFGPILGFEEDVHLLRLGRWLNTTASVLAIVLLAHLGRAMFSPTVGLLAAFMLAVDPILVFFNALVLTETIYLALLIAAYDVLMRRTVALRFSTLAFAGLLLGLATLLRGSSLLLPLVIAPFVLLHNTRHSRDSMNDPADAPNTPSAVPDTRTRRFAAACIFVLAGLAPLLPTAIRNYRLFGEFVPVRTGSGASLLEALGPWADGGPGMEKIRYPDFPPDADEVTRDRLCRERALQWLRDHPGRAAELAIVKLRRTWSCSPNAPDFASPLYVWTARLSVMPVFLLAIAGIIRLRQRPALLALLLAPAAYFTLLHMVFVGSVRYRLPAMPMLFLLAAVAFESFRLRGRRFAGS